MRIRGVHLAELLLELRCGDPWYLHLLGESGDLHLEGRDALARARWRRLLGGRAQQQQRRKKRARFDVHALARSCI